MAFLVEGTKPFKVRASCGHIVIRRMREATAGVPYTPEVVLDAPNGRECDTCETEHNGFSLCPHGVQWREACHAGGCFREDRA